MATSRISRKSRAFHTERRVTAGLGALNHALGNAADVAIGITGGDDQGIGDVSETADIQNLDVDGLHVIQRRLDQARHR